MNSEQEAAEVFLVAYLVTLFSPLILISNRFINVGRVNMTES